MLALYHMPNAVCPQKVRICLAEKGVEWESRLVTPPMMRSPEYLKMNPGGYVPTLIHDDRILVESRIVSEYINDAFDGPDLLPKDPYDKYRVAYWTKQIDDTALNVFTLTCALLFRPNYLAMPPEKREGAMALDITKRERTRDIIDKGEESHYVAAAVARFAKLAADMERSLQQSQWLACDQYTLADADYTPYLQRLIDLGLSGLFKDKPAVMDWWDRVRSRPSFREVQKAWMTQEELDGLVRAAERGAKAFEPHMKAA